MFNNMFQIVMCNMNDVITSIFDYTLQDGNPNVNDIRTNLNGLLLNKVVISYDRIRNKFIYIRTLPITTDNFTTYQPRNIVFMKPIDVASNGLLKYNNEDGGDTFQYRISNIEQITYFKLPVHNQDDEFILKFSYYILWLQFTRKIVMKNVIA